MYDRFFGFSRPLFGDAIAQDDDVFLTDATGRIGHELDVALGRKDSVAIITGTPGVGKTTIATESLRHISTRLAFACITQTPTAPQELLEQLLADYGQEPYRLSRTEQLQLWRQFLAEMAATDTRVAVLVENAGRLGAPLLRALHDLTASDASLTPGANIVLTTAQDPAEIFSSDDLLPLRQRVRLTTEICPLSQAETKRYLAFKCAGAGAQLESVFAPEFAPRLYVLSGGIIRMIDNLLESVLRSAADSNEKPVTDRRLDRVARQFGITRMSDGDVDRLLTMQQTGVDEEPSTINNIPTLTDCITDSALVAEAQPERDGSPAEMQQPPPLRSVSK